MSIQQPSEGAEQISTRAAVREKALAVQAQQARSRMIRIAVISTVIVLASSAVAFGVYRAVGDVAAQPARYPTGLESDGIKVISVNGVEADATTTFVAPLPEPTVVGEGEEPEVVEAEPEPEPMLPVVDIHIYVDYLSENSGEFQRTNARQLSGWIAQGAVTVTYHPVALMTASSNGTRYSLRAAAASACVATHLPERFFAFNNELLVNQPARDSDGPSDTELADLAVAVGAESPKIVRACIENQHFVVWAREATARALEGPLPGTDGVVLAAPPMIVVGGQVYLGALDNPAEFSQFVLSVASDAYYANNPAVPSDESTAEEGEAEE